MDIKTIGVSPSGKATVFGIVIRWFESSHPSQVEQLPFWRLFFYVWLDFELVRVNVFENEPFRVVTRTGLFKIVAFQYIIKTMDKIKYYGGKI